MRIPGVWLQSLAHNHRAKQPTEPVVYLQIHTAIPKATATRSYKMTTYQITTNPCISPQELAPAIPVSDGAPGTHVTHPRHRLAKRQGLNTNSGPPGSRSLFCLHQLPAHSSSSGLPITEHPQGPSTTRSPDPPP